MKQALYGATGTRKTLQIGHLIDAFGADKVGIVSCERGLGTIASRLTEPHVFHANSMEDFRAAFDWARKRAAADPAGWICVDGGTRVMQWSAGEIWAGTDEAFVHLAMGKPKNELRDSVKPYLRFIAKEGDINGQAQWIEIGKKGDRLLNAWVTLPCNIYWTFWETQTSIDQYRKGLPWQVDAPGTASRDAIMGSFDFVFRLSYDGETLVATADPANRVSRAKVRDDWKVRQVKKEMRDFNLAQFVNYLKGDGA